MTQQTNDTLKTDVLYMALELSAKKWCLAIGPDQRKPFRKTIDSWDRQALLEAIEKAKRRYRISGQATVYSCYEAGQDGFSVHRLLEQLGIENKVVDSSSIEVNRKKRRTKTDRVDAEKLLKLLHRYEQGERGHLSVLRIPSKEQEDMRRKHREYNRLKREATSHRNRIRMLLKTQGVRTANFSGIGWLRCLDKLRDWEGKPLPERLKEELYREVERFELVHRQLNSLEKQMELELQEREGPVYEKIKRLSRLKGVSMVSAWKLVMEWFHWRTFKNRKAVGSAAGLCGVPYASGESNVDQGISKSGNAMIRGLMLELAWCWLRYQPDSELSLWFKARFAGQGKRIRRKGVVAVARKLLILFWRYVERGELGEEIILKSA